MRVGSNLNLKTPSFGSLKNLGSKAVERLHKLDDITSVGQRALIGGSALFLQPLIDLNNKKVDEKTRESSAARSVARAVVGTTTGLAIRAATIKLADVFAKDGKALDFKITEKHARMLAKKGETVARSLSEASKDQIKNYSATIGTLIGLGVMLFTNFMIDVPGVNWMQNLIMKHRENQATKTQEVKNATAK